MQKFTKNIKEIFASRQGRSKESKDIYIILLTEHEDHAKNDSNNKEKNTNCS